jgi:ribosome-binding factor A
VPREFSRSQRMGTQVLRTLSELLRFESKDPRLKGISLTAVELTRDLSVARVHFSLFNPDEDVEPVIEGLAKANGFLRAKLGSELKVRHVPQLRFVHDDSAKYAAHISDLLDSARPADSEE